VSHRPLPEGDWPRQDRLVHGRAGPRVLLEPLDQPVCESLGHGSRNAGAVPACRGKSHRQGGPAETRFLYRASFHAALAPVGGTYYRAVNGGPDSETGLGARIANSSGSWVGRVCEAHPTDGPPSPDWGTWRPGVPPVVTHNRLMAIVGRPPW